VRFFNILSDSNDRKLPKNAIDVTNSGYEVEPVRKIRSWRIVYYFCTFCVIASRSEAKAKQSLIVLFRVISSFLIPSLRGAKRRSNLGIAFL
ncbi:MAG: hypothetical protein ACP5TY_07755, partial [Thermodesulforhabdaceae bacterium]